MFTISEVLVFENKKAHHEEVSDVQDWDLLRHRKLRQDHNKDRGTIRRLYQHFRLFKSSHQRFSLSPLKYFFLGQGTWSIDQGSKLTFRTSIPSSLPCSTRVPNGIMMYNRALIISSKLVSLWRQTEERDKGKDLQCSITGIHSPPRTIYQVYERTYSVISRLTDDFPIYWKSVILVSRHCHCCHSHQLPNV